MYSWPLWLRYAVSSKYATSNKVVVPSQALGVKMGASTSTNPSAFMTSRNASMISARILRIAACRGERSHR